MVTDCYSPEATPKLSSNQLVRDYFLINVSWEFYNSPGYVTKPSMKNNS